MIENWPVKALSIGLALFLFVFHRLNTMTTRPLSVPLTIETSSDLMPASAYPHNIRVTLRGEDDGIRLIADGDIEAYVDFNNHEEGGLYTAPIHIRKKGNALTVEPLEIAVHPMRVTIQLERRISKTLPLAVPIRGRVADGFDLISHSIAPREVVVIGPHSALESVSEIRTEPVDLEGRNASFTVGVNITNPNPLLEMEGSGIAEFSGVIQPAVLVRSIEGIPITLAGLDPAFEADMGGRTGSIRFEGRQPQIDTFRVPDHFFIVDCSGLSVPGIYTVPVIVNLPSDFSLIRREPENVTLIITQKEDAF